MHSFHKSNHHRGSFMVSRGKSPRFKRDPNFLCPLSMSFFLRCTYTLQITTFKFVTFQVHLPYLGDYVHFLGINAHNSSSNNRCMKGCTRMAWKTMLMPFSKFSCLLQGRDRYFDEMCGNSQPQTFVYWVFNYRKTEINAWKTWCLAWCHGMTSPCIGKNLRRFGVCCHACPS